jgi:hypothetical protein
MWVVVLRPWKNKANWYYEVSYGKPSYKTKRTLPRIYDSGVETYICTSPLPLSYFLYYNFAFIEIIKHV